MDAVHFPGQLGRCLMPQHAPHIEEAQSPGHVQLDNSKAAYSKRRSIWSYAASFFCPGSWTWTSPGAAFSSPPLMKYR